MICSFCGAKADTTILVAAPLRDDVMVCRACAVQIVVLVEAEERRRLIVASDETSKAEAGT